MISTKVEIQEPDYYYVECSGIYIRGVEFITTDKDLAIEKCKLMASLDVDDYHAWNVMIIKPYIITSETVTKEVVSEEIFTCRKVMPPKPESKPVSVSFTPRWEMPE